MASTKRSTPRFCKTGVRPYAGVFCSYSPQVHIREYFPLGLQANPQNILNLGKQARNLDMKDEKKPSGREITPRSWHMSPSFRRLRARVIVPSGQGCVPLQHGSGRPVSPCWENRL